FCGLADNSNESSSLGSDSLLQSSRLTGGGSVGGNPVLRAGVLRPSVLGPSRLGSALSSSNNSTSTQNATSTVTDGQEGAASGGCDSGGPKPAEKASEPSSSNPFLKEIKDDEDAGTSSKAADNNKGTDNEESSEERADPLTLLRKNGMERANLFAAAKSSIPLVEKSGFVFGQNLHERVVGEHLKSDKPAESNNDDSSTSASGELLFSSVIQNAAAAAKPTENPDKDANAEAKSLTDVAREYEESRAQKRKYEEVETFTGEENEVNIVDLNCKLFAFVNSNWEERGRGSLRLNDSRIEHECSRLVFRTAGNLRLLLNTKVWGGMVAERPSQKSLRLTAMDNTGKIKIFLVMARPAEIKNLHSALVERIEKRKLSHPDDMSTANSGAENSGESNGEEANSNDAAKHDEVAASAVVAEPDHDDSTEPSPKKPLLTPESSSSTKVQQQEEVSDN
ncbi:ran-binding protein 3, partial [Musca vetustissima]|uniref:ran-binding protein 3 n=1 Tax=Musca vetustissima TaxID=27455 RepID=UPI002AB5E83E